MHDFEQRPIQRLGSLLQSTGPSPRPEPSQQPCPVCGDTVRQVIYSDSTFQYCPTCQTGGKVLADRVLSRLVK